jgi:hypothetical protein
MAKQLNRTFAVNYIARQIPATAPMNGTGILRKKHLPARASRKALEKELIDEL